LPHAACSFAGRTTFCRTPRAASPGAPLFAARRVQQNTFFWAGTEELAGFLQLLETARAANTGSLFFAARRVQQNRVAKFLPHAACRLPPSTDQRVRPGVGYPRGSVKESGLSRSRPGAGWIPEPTRVPALQDVGAMPARASHDPGAVRW